MAAENKAFGELFAEKKNELDHLQKSLASIIPSFPGQMTAKYFDLAIGIDFHATVFPPSPLLPVPHIGMVFDIVGAILTAIASVLPPPPPPPEPDENGNVPAAPTTVLSVASAIVNAMKPSVKVHGQWVANAGTSIQHLPGIFVHIPFPIVTPMASSEMWMGSSTVLADGGPCSTQFHPAMSCNLIGIPSIPRLNKKPRPKMALMAPTSMLLIITSGGGPVLVGGPPTIDLFQLAFKMGLKGMGKLAKKGTKAAKKILPKNTKLGNILQSAKCRLFGEPVDAATGRVYANNLDFELPGPIPLSWERTYYSDAEVETSLGYNWHHSYNMGIYDMQNGFYTLRLSDGREIGLPSLALGEIFYNRAEQLSWQRDREGYLLLTADKLLYRFNGTKNKEGFQTLSSIQNASENNIRFFYDAKGRLQKIIDSSNRILKIENDELGHIACISTTLNGEEINLVRYDYDAVGNMVNTFDAKDCSKSFYYEEHLLVKLRNQSGMHFYWEYEGRGDDAKCIHTWGDGGVLEYWTQYEEGKTTTRNSLGHTTAYFYHSNKLIYKIIDANGGDTHQNYNDYQELDAVIDPEGHTQLFVHNEFGKLVKLVNENEEATTYSYDAQLNLTRINTPGGMQVQWAYDDMGRVISRTNVDGNTITYGYSNNQLSILKDHKDRKFFLQYDSQQNLTELILPNGKKQQWNYDELGRLLQTVTPRDLITRYKYDVLGNVVWMKEPDGNEHQFTYDASGNLEVAEDAGHKVAFTYGVLGVLKSRTQNNTTVQFSYDTELQLRSIANEGGEVYKFGLDAIGNVVSEWGFDGMQRRYVRDGNGRVQKVLRPAERWTSYNYDGVGNIVKEEHHDESLAAYRYNKDGMLVEAFNEEGQILLQRDKAGRVIKETQGNYEVTKKYDEEGNCIFTGSSLGAAIDMQFDEEGNVIKMNASSSPFGVGQEGASWQAGFKRDESGLELYREMNSGVKVQTERDMFGRVTRRSIGVGNAEQSRVRYDWATIGQRLNKTVNELTKAQTNYDYDAFDNLISAAYDEKGTTETIYRVPDRIGNLFKTKDKSDRKYSAGGRLIEDEKYHYHYDAEGNIIFKEFKNNSNELARDKTLYAEEVGIKLKATNTGWAYEWASNGMLRQVINPGGKSVVFSYDPLGRRIAKQYKGRITRWVWDGNVPLHEWKCEGGFPPQSSIDETGEIIETKEPVENLITWVFEDGSFVPCAKIENENQYSIVADYLGTPTHAYNSAGEKVWEREIDCYGKVRRLNGDKDFCPYLYQGQSVDEETGLAYNRFRYYDNESGSYLSQDPIGLEGGMISYGYVRNPNSWLDIYGLTGDGGAYMFKMSDGKTYVGKGSEARMNESIAEHTAATPTRPGRTIDGAAHMPTNGNNEMGKSLEFKTMANEGAIAKNGKNKAVIPSTLDNKIVTGSSAYNALSAADKAQVDTLAVELKQKMNNDIKAKAGGAH